MVTGSLPKKLNFQSPPRLPSREMNQAEPPVDTRRAVETQTDNSLRNTLKAMALLATSLAPQVSQAATAEVEMVQSIEATEQAESESTLDRVEDHLDGLRDKVDDFKSRFDTNGYLDEHKSKVGDYDLVFKPIDLDLKPRLNHGNLGLKFRGELLETTLSKTDQIDGNWSVRQGVSAKIRGEATTYDAPYLDLEAGVFKEYRGTLGDSYQASFRGDIGIRQRFVGDDEGLRAGVSFRQEIEGGSYQAFGTDFSLYAEGRQSAYHNIDSGKTDLSYKFMAGPKKDFDLNLFGHKGKLTVTVGPEIKGDNNGEAFELGLGSKVRARF